MSTFFTNVMSPYMQTDAMYKSATASSAPYTGGMSQTELAYLQAAGEIGVPKAAHTQYLSTLIKNAQQHVSSKEKLQQDYIEMLSKKNDELRAARQPSPEADAGIKGLFEANHDRMGKNPASDFQRIVNAPVDFEKRVGMGDDPRERTRYEEQLIRQSERESIMRAAGLPNRAVNLYMQPFMPTYIRETAPGGARRRRRRHPQGGAPD